MLFTLEMQSSKKHSLNGVPLSIDTPYKDRKAQSFPFEKAICTIHLYYKRFFYLKWRSY